MGDPFALGVLCLLLAIMAVGYLFVRFVAWLTRLAKGDSRPAEPSDEPRSRGPHDLRSRELRDLRITVERINHLVEMGLLDPHIADDVLTAVRQRREQFSYRPAVARMEPQDEEARLFGAVLADAGAALETSRPEALPVQEAELVQAEPASLPLPPVAPPPLPAPSAAPRRSWGDVLAGFMEERNILWGELVGGLLIVGCSAALVISLWQTLEAIPYFPFVVFSAISLALFGAGRYTLHHWKLESTSRGLLVITSLLLPLNLLVLAGISRGAEGGAVEIAVTLISLAIFAAVARKAGQEAIGGDGWTPALAVVGASTAPLLLPWLNPLNIPWLPALLAGLTALCYVVAVAARLRALPGEEPLPGHLVRSLFLLGGIATFSAGAALAFLTAQSPFPSRTLHELAAPLSLLALTLFLAGLLLLQRQLAGAGEGLIRTGATAVALFGLLLLLTGLALGWTLPGLLLAICLFDAVLLAVIAFRLVLPWAHLAALPCAVLATLTAYHLLTGHLDPAGETALRMVRQMLSSESGVVLALLAVVLAVGAEGLIRLHRAVHAAAWAVGGLGVGLTALVLVTVDGTAHPGRNTLVYLLLGVTLLASDVRWRSTSLAAIGQGLVLAGTVWLLGWLVPERTAVWGVMLAGETLLLAALAAWREEDEGWHRVLTAPCAGLTPFAALLTLAAVLLARDFPQGWPHSLTALLLVAAALLWTWAARLQLGVWVAGLLLWGGLGHFLGFVLPSGAVASPALTGLLAAGTLLLAAHLWLRRPPFGERIREVFATPAGHATVSFTGFSLVLIALLPTSAVTRGLHLAWLGGLWLLLAWFRRSREWLAGAQVVFSLAAVVLSFSGVDARSLIDAVEDPLRWQICGIALTGLGLVWVMARRLLRRSETAQVIFSPPWPAPDRVLLGLLPIIFLLGSIIGCWPVLELRLMDDGLFPTEAHFVGWGMWLLLGTLWLLLSAALWDRDEDVALPGLMLVGLAVPFLLAGRFAEIADSLGVLPLTMSGVLLLLSLPIWLRRDSCLSWPVRLSRDLLLGGAVGVVVLVSLVAFGLALSNATMAGIIAAVLLACLGMVGHALRERSSLLVFLGGLLLNLAASLGVWQGTLALPLEESWPYLIQANLIAAAGVALAWLACQRRFTTSWPPSVRDASLLAVQTALAPAGLLLLLLIPLGWMFLDPRQGWPEYLMRIGEAGGWIAAFAAFAASLWFCRRWRPAGMPHVLGMAGLALGVLMATSASRIAASGDLSWLTLLMSWSLLGLLWTGELELAVRQGGRTAPRRLWVELMAVALILVGLRGFGSTIALPWTSAGPVLLAAVLFGAVALFVRSAPEVYLSGTALVVAVLLAWSEWGTGAGDEFLLVLASAMAVAGLIWSPLSAWRGVPTFFPALAALAGLGLLGLVALDGWLIDAIQPSALTWICFSLVAAALVALLWDERGRPAPAGLYLLGLIGVVLLLNASGSRGERATALATLLLTGHVLISTVICRAARQLESFARSVGLAPWVCGGPVSNWWLAAQEGFAGVALLLGFGLSLDASSWLDRAAGAVATLFLLLAALYFAAALSGDRRALCRRAGLALGPLLLAEIGFILLDPIGVAGLLHHAALGLAALVLCCVCYRELFPVPDWKEDAQRVGIAVAIAALTVLGGLMLLEMRTYDLQKMHTPLTVLEVILAALAVAALLGLSLCEAMKPPGRTAFVYAAEVLLVVLFVHLRWNIPGIKKAASVQYWPFQIMGVAYAGAALGELFRRRGLEVLATPLHTTGLVLPLLPLLAFWLRPDPALVAETSSGAPGLTVLLAPLQYLPEHYSTQAILWFVTALMLLAVAIARQSMGYMIAAALTANVGLWMLLTHHGVGLFLHPQLWLVPLGLIILVAEHVNREGLGREQRLALRYAGLLLLYLSSTADLFLNGIGVSVWLPLALAVLSVVGVLAGIVLRVRAFLLMGLLFLLIDVLSMIWHAAVERTQTWVWYVSGIILGAAILALFAVFEKRRDDVLRLVENIKRWE